MVGFVNLTYTAKSSQDQIEDVETVPDIIELAHEEPGKKILTTDDKTKGAFPWWLLIVGAVVYYMENRG